MDPNATLALWIDVQLNDLEDSINNTRTMISPVRLRATFEAYLFEDDEQGNPIEEPRERRGWVNPTNPWGSFEQDTDDTSADPDTITLTLWEAAQFVKDFSGAVWNYSEGESEQNVRTGEWKSVTLHVLNHEDTVFALADTL